jgi:hypothetical protein
MQLFDMDDLFVEPRQWMRSFFCGDVYRVLGTPGAGRGFAEAWLSAMPVTKLSPDFNVPFKC